MLQSERQDEEPPPSTPRFFHIQYSPANSPSLKLTFPLSVQKDLTEELCRVRQEKFLLDWVNSHMPDACPFTWKVGEDLMVETFEQIRHSHLMRIEHVVPIIFDSDNY